MGRGDRLGQHDLRPDGRARRPRAATSSYSGCALTHLSVEPGDLDRDRMAVDLDRGHLAVQRVLVDPLLAQADGGGLGRPSRRTASARSARDQHAQGVRRPALLHQDRGQPGVARAGVEQGARAPPGHTRGSRSSTLASSSERRPVVEERARASRDHSSPTRTRSTLACPSGSRPPAPMPIVRRPASPAGRPSWSASVVSSAAPVGVHSSSRSHRAGPTCAARRAAARRPPAAGPAARPCSVPDRAPPDGDRRDARRRVDARGARSRRRRRRRRRSRPARRPRGSARPRRVVPWTAASAWASRAKTSRARRPHRPRAGRPRRAALGRRARCGCVVGVRDLDVAPGRREARRGVTCSTLEAHLARARPRRPRSASTSSGHPGADQGAEQHVAAGARRRRRPRRPVASPVSHGRSARVRATRAANTPAPNPLSMLHDA